ncbi:transglutaminaseTgpA domain-containing protein [Neptunicella marina]|uniref:DUF3488 domain-containing transglutaminase family protein n=1 Tax=Neptunicella marina TaxID=2125989 RepID=A0A8J6IS16_9ALTE|nr:DUF3488 and transglutaminase-like domain-containing protein [Neptunicella marina]MBC3764353.1 DUF3488 domain-containing transglutaminase family protein [Neptunicella marina]
MASNRQQLLLTCCLLLSCIALFDVLLIWVSGLLIISGIIRISLLRHTQKHTITQRTLNLLAVLSLVVLFWYGWQIGLMNSMLNLLVLACAFKLIKLENHKDFLQLSLSTLFIIACGFMFYQQIIAVVFYSLLVIALLFALQSHFQPNRTLPDLSTELIKQISFAIPVSLLLFIALPHLPPLWQMPGMNQAQSGLSDTLNPGDLSRVAQSAELAFSAEFQQKLPTRTQLYWRAQVMEVFNGKQWSRHPYRLRQQQQLQFSQHYNPRVFGEHYRYSVVAQPTGMNLLYALDVATPVSDDVIANPSYQLTSKFPLVSTISYEVISWYQTPLDQASSFDLVLNLQLPPNGNPRARAFAKQLAANNPTVQQKIRAVLQYYKQQSFVYSLQPDVMPDNMVDTFLFEKKKGFCAHYAASMAYLLRLMGIPARVVTGYMGGENQSGNRINVYQFDAHAWVEAWHEDKGWVRYDPTAVVSPERLLYGLEQAVAYENSFLTEQPFSLMKFKSVRWLNQLRLAFAQMDYWWNSWVVGFNQRQQLSIISAIFGSATLTNIGLFTLGALGIILFIVAVYIWKNKPKSTSPVAVKYYLHALKILKKHGYQRQYSQGPEDYYQQIKTSSPLPVFNVFKRLHNNYMHYQYAGKPSMSPKRLKAELKQLKHVLRTSQS